MKKFLSLIFFALVITSACAALTACRDEDRVVAEIEIVCGEYVITYTDGSVEHVPGPTDDGHSWNDGSVTTAATCTTEGIKTYSCEKCGAIKEEPIEADGGHSWDEGSVTTAATCTTVGIKTYSCEKCGAVSKELIEADGTHVYGDYDNNTKYHWQSCLLCGEITGDDQHALSGWAKYYDVKYPNTQTTIGTVEKCGCATCGFTQIRAIAAVGYEFTGWSNGLTEQLLSFSSDRETGGGISACFRIEKLELPVFEIFTEGATEIESKDVYTNCSVSVSNTSRNYCLENHTGKIKGRGNSTWNMPKKPYKLKFDVKTDLFGNGAAKTWTLIANYCDPSLIRNYLAYSIGAEFEHISDTTTKTQFVDVYMNGRYDGVYLICEQNETGKTRVNIQDDFAKAPNPEDMGYLIEMDGRAPEEGTEGLDYVTVMERYFAIKSPDYEDLGAEIERFSDYVSYIQGYLSDTLDALSQGSYIDVTNLLDVNSFADSYIVHELFHTIDVGHTSFYVYKKENGKLFSGPIWDFDISCGNCNYSPNGILTDYLWAENTNIWYNLLLQFDEFKELVAQRLNEKTDTIKLTIQDSKSVYDSYKNSFLRNYERWQILGTNVWPNTSEIVAITTWEGQVEYVLDWLGKSLEYMLSVYSIN